MLNRIRRKLFTALSPRSEPEYKIIQDSQKYWTNRDDRNLATNSHWRGNGPFQDDQLWLSLGSAHRELLLKVFEWTDILESEATIVEWGCGGGMNAVAMAPVVKRYFGVDISKASLNESQKQVKLALSDNFQSILIEAENPEAAVGHISALCDCFLSTYVFELLPTPEYATRVLDISTQLLRAGGAGLIQIRYSNGAESERSIRRNYEENVAQMTTFLLDEFWVLLRERGLEPLFVTLLPEQPELRESRYAYFAFRKPRTSG